MLDHNKGKDAGMGQHLASRIRHAWQLQASATDAEECTHAYLQACLDVSAAGLFALAPGVSVRASYH